MKLGTYVYWIMDHFQDGRRVNQNAVLRGLYIYLLYVIKLNSAFQSDFGHKNVY